MSQVHQRLADLGIELPQSVEPIANYVPVSPAAGLGHLLFISGQGTRRDGVFQFVGKVGSEFGIDDGYEAARICAINLLAQMSRYCEGDLDRVVQVHKITGYVNCTPEFKDVPKVLNGASDLLVAALGEFGRHARTAVGVAALPAGMAVEVDATVEIAGPGRIAELGRRELSTCPNDELRPNSPLMKSLLISSSRW